MAINIQLVQIVVRKYVSDTTLLISYNDIAYLVTSVFKFKMFQLQQEFIFKIKYTFHPCMNVNISRYI